MASSACSPWHPLWRSTQQARRIGKAVNPLQAGLKDNQNGNGAAPIWKHTHMGVFGVLFACLVGLASSWLRLNYVRCVFQLTCLAVGVARW